jgi:hypothetical protein
MDMVKKNFSGRSAPKLFSFLDLIPYAVLALTLVALFVFLVVLPKTSKADGFKIELYGKQIATYDYATKTLSVEKGYEANFEIEGDSITVYTDQNRIGFNVITIDAKNRSAKISEANCSASKDCVYTPALKGTEGAIICAPHALKVVPISYNNMTPPQTGGAR